MKCVIFTHFARQNIKDESGKQIKTPLINDKQMNDQKIIWREQLKPYSKCKNVNLIYIFIIDGYEALLSGVIPFEALMIEKRMRKVLEEAASEVGLIDKVQIIGIEELLPTLAGLQGIAVSQDKRLNFLLLGGGKTPYYDSPKMVEAFIRLGRGMYIQDDELILRFDQDVAVNQMGIGELINFYNNLQYGRNKYEFHFFSGNYRYNESIGKPEDLLNDYAIRTHLFASENDVKLDNSNVRYDIAKRWLNSIAEIGADPYNQVISGAGLSMSLKAISTLPPFANAGTPIMWIDDHLKRRLHEALKDLPAPTDKNYNHSPRCCDTASFKQDRHPYGVTQEDISWAMQYLPRLARGIVIDNLIWDHNKQKPGLYAKYVKRVIRGKTKLTEKKSEKLRVVLRGALGRRIFEILDEIKESWSTRDYKTYPLYKYATRVLPNKKSQLFDEVIEALHSYLTLLDIWEPFVELWQDVKIEDPDYKWLFRDP